MKALLITGTLAEGSVKEYARQSKIASEVVTLKTPVAALLSPQKIIASLQKISLKKKFDVILVPGQICGETTQITETIGIPTFKGPRYAADLPEVLDSLGEVELSSVVPACDLLREKLRTKALEELEKVEKNYDALIKKPGNLLIGDLPVGKDFPMRVLAEIVDAPLLENSAIQSLAKSYVKSGANMIDVGMMVGQCKPEEAARAVEAVKAVVDVPVSIDTLNPVEIEAAVKAGVDLILSGDAGNLEELAPFASDVPLVIIPTNQRKGFFPKNVDCRVRMLERLTKKAASLGFSKIIGDLVLDPCDLIGSLIAFKKFSSRNPGVPLLIGIANVVELFDADSVGLNALLARLSAEINSSILLVTEKSAKARGSVREVAVAAKMMFLAKKRNSVPRDLGLDLLILKDRSEKEMPFSIISIADSSIIPANDLEVSVEEDPCGIFRIMVDRENGDIVVLHYASSKLDKPLHVIRGKRDKVLMFEILRLGLISHLDHAMYLGHELGKAEIALKIGRGYVQDMELF